VNPLGVPVGYGGGTATASVDQVRAEALWAATAGFDSFWVCVAIDAANDAERASTRAAFAELLAA
jgi:hypothetical protein